MPNYLFYVFIYKTLKTLRSCRISNLPVCLLLILHYFAFSRLMVLFRTVSASSERVEGWLGHPL